MKVSASIDKVDFMALSLHVPARSAPVAGTRFKWDISPKPRALSIPPVAVHAIICAAARSGFALTNGALRR